VDTNTQNFCLDLFLKELRFTKPPLIYIFPNGENAKNGLALFSFLNFLLESKISKHDLLISLGGGAISDVAGFAASIYKRGVNIIHVPTTLIGMVDAAYGGKTGINLSETKNILGTYHFPLALIIHHPFLSTLPPYEIKSGYAEMLKCACLKSDDLLQEVKQSLNRNELPAPELIYNCLAYKAEVVKKDPFESGERFFLNFGHTLGHAIEAFSLQNQKAISHGHAVALGMYYALRISVLKLNFSPTKAEELQQFISAHFEMLSFSAVDAKAILNLVFNDKKNNQKGIRMVLLRDVGNPELVESIGHELILAALSLQ
jgi:3-dehydroquinate synthase